MSTPRKKPTKKKKPGEVIKEPQIARQLTKHYPDRTPSYIQRRIAFAEAFCRTGNPVDAFLAVTPQAAHWKPESIRREAHTLLHDPITSDAIAEINVLNQASVIPRLNEVTEMLSGVMRGTTTAQVITKDGDLVDVPPGFGARLNAAKQLIPLLQTREALEIRRTLEAERKPIEDPEAEIAKMMGLTVKPLVDG